MKNILIVASVASMIDQFTLPTIEELKVNGYSVEVATNFENPGTISKEKAEKLKNNLELSGVKTINLEFNRNPINPENFKVYKKLKKIIEQNNYDIIHCHSPIGGIVTRLAAIKNKKSKVIYTAHGFHFFKGSSVLNWLVFFPIEYAFSYFTDVLITINKEDYNLAKNKMLAKKIEYIPGIGFDVDKFKNAKVNISQKRLELGIEDSNKIIISVGELCDRKNHETIIEAISLMKHPPYYIICGRGELETYLKEKAEKVNVGKYVKLLGYRTDIAELCKIADAYVFPSKREGLGIAALEGMAAGLPIITSNVNGILDYSVDNVTGFSNNPTDIFAFKESIEKILNEEEKWKKIGLKNQEIAQNFDKKIVLKKIMEIYSE